MITLRRSNERGHFDHGWLHTYHTFSFGEYRDPKHMGFRSLRVLNDDVVDPGAGFGMHPHRDMEIVTYILSGALEHRDSMGNRHVLRAGDIQRMSAGSGVLHSEYNHSAGEPVHLLQTWILPAENGTPPSYEDRTIPTEAKRDQLLAIVGGTAPTPIGQDAVIYATLLSPGHAVQHALAAGRAAWVHVARGAAVVNGQALTAGDAAAIEDEVKIEIIGGDEESELLLFDLA